MNPSIRKRRRRTASTETSIAEQLDLFSTVELPQSNEPSEENNQGKRKKNETVIC